MKPITEREMDAQAYYSEGQRKVAEEPEPEGQKFPNGSRVHIVKDLGGMMSHFPSDLDATVVYTYAHAYGGGDIESYCLDVDGHGQISWYEEHQLTAIPN